MSACVQQCHVCKVLTKHMLLLEQIVLRILQCTYLFLLVSCSPLHIAAKSGLVGVVKELINRGADLNVRDAEGTSHILVTKDIHVHQGSLDGQIGEGGGGIYLVAS